MDKLVSKLQKFSKTKRGITLIQIFFVVVAIIALSAIFNPIDLFNKATRGRETSGWVTDLSSVQNNILASKNKSDLLFGVTLKNDAPRYSLTVTAPPSAAYEDTREIVFEKVGVSGGNTDRSITYSSSNQIGYKEGTSGVPIKSSVFISDYKGKTATEGTLTYGMTGFAYSGSNGIAPFVNINISDIEEDLFYGLLGAEGTTIGDEMADADKSATINNATIKSILTMAFGKNGTGGVFNRTSDIPDRWIEATPIRQDALEELVGGNSRFYDENKYRLYLVTDIVPLASAFKIADKHLTIDSDPTKGATAKKEQTQAIEELYNAVTANISEDGILVIPNEKSDVVYSESSDFKRMKFGTAD